jgi:hypothetical protein
MTGLGGFRAIAVSGDGSVIVGERSSGYPAFIWDKQHGTRDIEYVLAMDYGITPLVLESPCAISEDGTTIVGLSPDYSWIVVLDPRTCKNCIVGDLNSDKKVDMLDFALMANNWLESN